MKEKVGQVHPDREWICINVLEGIEWVVESVSVRYRIGKADSNMPRLTKRCIKCSHMPPIGFQRTGHLPPVQEVVVEVSQEPEATG